MFKQNLVFMTVKLVLLLCVPMVTQGGETSNSNSPLAQKSPSCSVEQESPEAYALLELHNQSRNSGTRCEHGSKHTAPPLTWSCELASASLEHAKDMSDNNFLGHQGSDGSSIGGRAASAAYPWRRVAENVAKGQQNPDDAYASWVNSRAHCESIMNERYQDIGAAKVGQYWVVMFGQQ